MPLTQRCAAQFDIGDRLRGTRIFVQQDVTLVAEESCRALFLVEDASISGHQVMVRWAPGFRGDVAVCCSCRPHGGNRPCEHVWAALLAVDNYGWADDIPAHHRAPVVCLSIDHMLESEAAGLQSEADTLGKRARQGPASGWKEQLQYVGRYTSQMLQRRTSAVEEVAAHPQETWYVLNVGASREDGHLQIELYQRKRRLTGEFGKFQALSVNEYSVDRLPAMFDRELIAQLLRSHRERGEANDLVRYRPYYGYSPKRSEIRLDPDAYTTMLPRLCESPRFVWLPDRNQSPDADGTHVDWDWGPAWRFRLRIADDDQRRQWQIGGELTRGSETVPLSEPVLLQGHGVVLFADRLARLDARDDFGWIVLLREVGTLGVPYEERTELLGHLGSLPSLPEAELPASLQLDQVHLDPRGQLSVHARKHRGHEARLYADVAFRYGDHVMSWSTTQASFFDLDNHRIVHRDPNGERELFAQLASAGVRRRVQRYNYDDGDFELARRALPEIVDKLAGAGWIIEAEGQRIRQPGTYNLRVKSNVDWFELDGKFDFEGVSASLPAVLAAVRRGEKYVLLDDGSRGVLPEQWLKKYGALTELAQTDGETLRFVPSQAALLDALLAAQEQKVQVDTAFDQLRKKLQAFEGIQPHAEPSTFAGQLRHYQQDGLGWLRFLQEYRFGGCLADDMGLGKTVQVLALLESRRVGDEQDDDETRRTSLVIVPRSLVFNWMQEAERFTPNLKVLNYTGTARADVRDRLGDFDLVITTYGTLRRDIPHLKDVRFDYAILDEAQAIKNSQSQAAKACRLIHAQHRLAMTGTPVENHLGELWSLFDFLNPGMLGRSTAFKKLHREVSASQPVSGPHTSPRTRKPEPSHSNSHSPEEPKQNGSLAVLARALRPFLLRRTKEQVLPELPEKSEQTMFCEMSGRQRKLYDQLRDYYRASLMKRVEQQGIKKSKIHVLEALLRLRQAACHPGLLDDAKTHESSAKLEALLEQVAEVIDEGHKALVFSQFTSLLSIVRQHLDERRIAYAYLDGRTRKRRERVDRFQNDPNCPLFLISLKAGGHGLNLTAADYVFILDPWWNPAVEAQAVDRAHRIGQTRPVFAYRLICRDTVEEKILELQRTKRELADAIVSADNSLIRSLTADDLQLLLG